MLLRTVGKVLGTILVLAVVAITGLSIWYSMGEEVDLPAAGESTSPPSAERGKYVFEAGGCVACHTDAKSGGAILAGGPPLKTDWGTFYAPNITPDPDHGIGRWSTDQFMVALRHGIAPDGSHLYPAFPYTAYTKATRQDLLDLKAYLDTIPPSSQPNRPHQVSFPVSIRPILIGWKWLNFEPRRWRPDPSRDAVWNRGSYLVEALLHCAECHTPRNGTSGLDRARWMAGARIGADNNLAPNLTASANGIGDWSVSEIVAALQLGETPDGEFLGAEMADVVKDSTSHLTKEDLVAVATYLRALPPLPNDPAITTPRR